METPSERRLILILSSERSGSTLTRVILGENSRIVAPQEVFLMRYPDYPVDRVAKSVHGLPPVARQREVKWVMQQTIIREFLATVPDDQKWIIKFEHLVRNPEPVVGGLCEALGVAVEPKMLEACGARRIMNVHLGDPTFHTRDRIDAGAADAWRQSFTEDRLTRETRRMMDASGV